MDGDFPLEAPAVKAMREQIATQVLAVRDVEATVVAALKDAMD